MTKRSPFKRCVALLCVATVFAAACGGGRSDDDDDERSQDEPGQFPGELADEQPQSGGEVTYALNAATSGGWCLPESRLAPEGIQIARSIYDTLTVPDSEGKFQPHLAESVEPNPDYTQWTITLRPDVKFHDGTDLNAEVVANNINAWRGQYPTRAVDLFLFVYQDIANVTTQGDLTVVVDMARPWVSFDSHLFNYGRSGIMGQAQLDDENTCEENLVGTGPFQLSGSGWNRGDDTVQLERNDAYWRTDAEGNQLPYLDKLTYQVTPIVAQRVNTLLRGDIDAFHMYSNEAALEFWDMAEEADAGEVNFVHSDDFAEVGLTILNTSEPPFDNPIAREAMATAVDRVTVSDELSDGFLDNASGPFPPGSQGHLDDAGYPEYDPERAQQLVDQYEQETGQPLEFQIIHPSVPALERLVQKTIEYLKDAGMQVNQSGMEQSQLIDQVIDGSYQAATWRNYPGLDPDNLYVWWYGGGDNPNPINFGRFNDPEIDALFDQGRETDDEQERQQIYEDLNRRLNEELYMLWASYTSWGVAMGSDVYGVVGARAAGSPDDGSADYTGLAVGHDPALMWKAEG